MSAIVYIPAAACHHLTDLWQAQMAKVRANTDSRSAPPEAVTRVIVDATERPILTGIVAADYHDKVE